MTHWRKPREPRPPENLLGAVVVALTVGVSFAVLFALAFAVTVARHADKPEPRKVVRQAPPYYECDGPKETRHPRCDRD